jgi:hypothetical protein
MVDRIAIMRAVRQPKSAAIAGIVFGVILFGVILLLQSANPAEMATTAHWTDDPSRVRAVNLALNLIPFAGIAFLWFIAVIRAQLGSREDRFFETVFLGSGLLFIAMLFVAASALKSVLIMKDAGIPVSDELLTSMWALAVAELKLFGARMAAVFTISVATMGVRIGSVPRWLAIAGWLTGLVLLLTPPAPNWAQLLFPVWVLVLSLHILVGRRPQPL